MFFHFDQNNSGGSFDPIGINIIVEADNFQEANDRAEEFGLYFNGCDDGIDCPCCGDRWYEQYDDEDGMEVPSIYDTPVEQYMEKKSRWCTWSNDKTPEAVVYYKDGTIKKHHYEDNK